MLERLNSREKVESAARRIAELLAERGEWLYAEAVGRTSSLRPSECEVSAPHGRLLFSCLTEQGARVWHVSGWQWTGEKLLLEATRRMGAESSLLELIPRPGVAMTTAAISVARRERAMRLAQLACREVSGAKVERVGLSAGARSGQPGPYARIILRQNNRRIMLTGAVASEEESRRDGLLSSALLWHDRASERTSGLHAPELWLIVGRRMLKPMQRQLSLLRDDLKRSIRLYESDDEWQRLAPVRLLERAELWSEPTGRFTLLKEMEASDWARRVLALAPDAIDIARSRHGETLRFHGLAFARVRSLMGAEHAWLGLEGERRRSLSEENWQECVELVEQLREHRSPLAPNQHHALYRAAPEAWLESLLRRNIARLDPALRIAPLHAQFRTAGDGSAGTRPVDLLALRNDGRLVVIELKVSEDREHVLQAVDYWRRLEAHRKRGHLARARLFGDARIADEPPLVYLVAPLLRFHRALDKLARSIAPDVELYRFDINEDWRSGVRVMRRRDFNQ